MAISVMDLKKEIIRLRVALADTEALEMGTGERLEKVTAERDDLALKVESLQEQVKLSWENEPNWINELRQSAKGALGRACEERDQYKEAAMAASAIIAEMHYAAMGEVIGPKRGVVEDIADLKAGCDALRHALDCENRRFAEAHVEIKQLRDALVTIGDASQAAVGFRDLQVFARNVLKGLDKCNT